MSAWTIVECSGGALFSTKWVPLVSFKSVRLGPQRLQRCPVHRRFELVHRVDGDALSPADRESALRVRDSGII